MKHTLQITHLNKSYGKLKALKDVSLELNSGIYGLLGHNGAGKSTLLNILTTTLNYDDGEILFDGKPMRSDLDGYRHVLGFMPQAQSLTIDLNVESFMYYMASLKKIRNPKARIKELLEKTNMWKYRHRGLSGLSGGMKQRVMIAQALLNDPQLLLLDEPTAGLDPVERRNFRNLIASIAEERIIIIATHVISDVEFIASGIIMMKKGRILTCSSQEELMNSTKVYVTADDIDELTKTDPKLKVVNRMYTDGKIYTRFLSDQEYPNPVPATMDDVYLDWLE